jgi:glycosyltransferase involved in cell wall biosynthesis
MNKIRVMHVIEDLHIGGLERVVVTICRTLDPSRFESSVLVLRGSGPLERELEQIGAEVVDIGGQPGKGDYFAFRKVAREAGRRRIDVFHTHNSLPLFDALLARPIARVRGHVHTDHARNFPDKMRYMIAEHVASYFLDAIVAVSDHTRDNLVHYEKISPSRITVIPNGIDGDRFTGPLDIAEKRKELGLDSGPVIGLAARLMEQKGIIFLLQAMPELIRRFPGIQLLIAGSGDEEANLKASAASLGIAGHVRFLGVRLDIPELIRAFDVYVIPSIWEGLPMALLEAFAAGLPVVAADVGGIGTVMRHRENGSLVPPRDPSALAAELAEVLSNPQLQRRYREEGRRTFQEHYSATAMTSRYAAAYAKAAGEPRQVSQR